MRSAEERRIERLASAWLDERWLESWPGSAKEFDSVALDFAKSVEAAIDDCWHEYRKKLVARYA